MAGGFRQLGNEQQTSIFNGTPLFVLDGLSESGATARVELSAGVAYIIQANAPVSLVFTVRSGDPGAPGPTWLRLDMDEKLRVVTPDFDVDVHFVPQDLFTGTTLCAYQLV